MESRSVESIENVIKHAKLNTDHLHPVSQALFYGSNQLHPSEVRLMELPSKLASALQGGQTLVIRGDGTDSAVLCSSNMTFDLKEAETSNSFLVVDGLFYPDKNAKVENDQPREVKIQRVEGVFHRYLELRHCKPRLSKLRVILSENLYSGRNTVTVGPTYNDLLNRVQASEEELKQGLKDLRAILVKPGDIWCMVDTDYHMRVLSHICNFVAENSWSYDNVNKAETIQALKEIEPEFVVDQIFNFYFSVKSNDPAGMNYRVHREHLSRFFGEYLLQTGSSFDLNEFVSMWSQSMPEAENDDEGFSADLKHLQGVALVEESDTVSTIRSFPEHQLPETINERLDVLFRVREKWTVEEIAPYVECLTTPILNVNGLLTKYARAANVNGKKVFCSKHGK